MAASWLSILPPLVAIIVVLWKREVILALLLAVFSSELLQQSSVFSGILLGVLATLERIISVVTNADNARLNYKSGYCAQ